MSSFEPDHALLEPWVPDENVDKWNSSPSIHRHGQPVAVLGLIRLSEI